MKKVLSFSLFLILALSASAQPSATSLYEDFNASCATASGFPASWLRYDFRTHTMVQDSGSWVCTPANGRYNTPGMMCTGDYSGAYHTDSELLITPLLNLSDFPDSAFLQFDTKTTFVSGERVAFLISPDSTFTTDTSLPLNPVISTSDSSGWVTHQVNLTNYKDSGSFFAAFLYTSSNTFGTIWYIDNIILTPWSLGVKNVTGQKIPLTVTGNPTASEITLSYNILAGGTYNLVIYDMTGRAVHKEAINAEAGNATSTISGLNLLPGMYCIKMGNGDAYGFVKAIVV